MTKALAEAEAAVAGIGETLEPTPFQAELCRRVKIAKANGLSGRAIARKATLDHVTLLNLMRGTARDPALSTVERLAGALDCSVTDLIGGAVGAELAFIAGLIALPLAKLIPCPWNARREFDDASIAELAASIAEQGVLENLIVRPHKSDPPGDDFEVVAGERRRRALTKLHDKKLWPADKLVPCRRLDLDDGEALLTSLVENIQRTDLEPLEEAKAFNRLRLFDPAKWTTAIIARTVNKTSRHVQGRLALLGFQKPIQDAIAAGTIGPAAARPLHQASPAQQRRIVDQIKAGTLESSEEAIRRKVEGRFSAKPGKPPPGSAASASAQPREPAPAAGRHRTFGLSSPPQDKAPDKTVVIAGSLPRRFRIAGAVLSSAPDEHPFPFLLTLEDRYTKRRVRYHREDKD